MDARDIARSLARYARSDAFCRALNERLGWDVPNRALCLTHENDANRRNAELAAKAVELHEARDRLRDVREANEALSAEIERCRAMREDLGHELLAKEIEHQATEAELEAVTRERDELRAALIGGVACAACAQRGAMGAGATQIPDLGDSDADYFDDEDAQASLSGEKEEVLDEDLDDEEGPTVADGGLNAAANNDEDAVADGCATRPPSRLMRDNDFSCQFTEERRRSDVGRRSRRLSSTTGGRASGSLLRRNINGMRTFLGRRPSIVEAAIAETVADADPGGEDDEVPAAPAESRARGTDGGRPVREKSLASRKRKMKGLIHVAAGNMSLETLSETIYDIWEKKAAADATCRRDQVEPTNLELYVKQYFREKVGLKKMAREKTRTMLRVTSERADISPRVRLFAVCCGLEQYTVADGSGTAHYTPHSAHCVTRILGSLYAERMDAIAVSFREAPYNEFLVPRQQLTYGLIGSAGAMDAEVPHRVGHTEGTIVKQFQGGSRSSS